MIFAEGVITGYDWAVLPNIGAIARQWTSSLYLWTHTWNFAGASLTQGGRVLLNYFTFLFVLASLGLNGELISKVLVVGVLALAGIGGYTMLRNIGVGSLSAVLGGAVYMTTPVVYDLILLSGLGGLCGYDMLPFAFVAFLKARRNSHRWIKYCIVCSVLLVLWPLHILFVGIALFTLFSICDMLVQRSKTLFLTSIKCIAVISIVSFFLQSYWTVPTILSMFSEISALPFASWSIEQPWLIEIARVQGFWLPAFEADSIGGMFSMVAVGSLVVPLLSFTNLILFPKKTTSLFASFSAVFVLVGVSSGFVKAAIQANLGGIAFAFRNLTPIFTILAFAYVILFSQVMDFLVEPINRLSKMRMDVAFLRRTARWPWRMGLLLIIILVYGYYIRPFYLAGDFEGRLQTITYPDYYQLTYNWIDQRAGNFKTLWLPMGSGYIHETWKPGVWSHVDYSVYSTASSGLPVDPNVRYQFPMQLWLEDLLYSRRSAQIGKILGLYSVRYIALRNETEVTNWGTSENNLLVSLRETSMIAETLGHEADIKVKAEFGNITVYENPHSLPLIYGVPSLSVVTGDLSTFQELLGNNTLDFRERAIAFASQQSDHSVVQLASDIIVARGTIADLLVPYLPTYTIYDPGLASTAQYATTGWVDLHQWYWWYDTASQAALERAAIAFGSINSSLSQSIDVATNEDSYVLLVKVNFLEFDRGSVKIEWDGSTVGIIRAQPDARGKYGWFALKSLYTRAGAHKLELETDTRVSVARILIAPESTMDAALNTLEKAFGIPSSLDVTVMLGTNGIFVNGSPLNYATPNVTFHRIAPTKYLVHVNTDNPFFLIFSENFHKSWKAYVDSAEAPHFQANGFANAWYIKKIGSFDITLEFAGQGSYQDMRRLALVMFAVCLLYLLVPDTLIRRRLRERPRSLRDEIEN